MGFERRLLVKEIRFSVGPVIAGEGPIDGIGRAARMATSSLHLTMECRDAPAGGKVESHALRTGGLQTLRLKRIRTAGPTLRATRPMAVSATRKNSDDS